MQQQIQDVNELRDLLINTEDINELRIRIDTLESTIEENQAVFNNTGEVVKMIENVNDKVNDLTEGNTNVEISYDSNILRPGDGIYLDRRTPNRVSVQNTNQNYNISNTSILNVLENNVIELGTFANYIRHENDEEAITLVRDLEIFIDDSKVRWKKGQTVKLVFADEFIPGIYDIKIKTDALNIASEGIYGITIGVVNELDFQSSNNRPIFELVCIDENSLKFKVDKIR
jgi:hypothetical protein